MFDSNICTIHIYLPSKHFAVKKKMNACYVSYVSCKTIKQHRIWNIFFNKMLIILNHFKTCAYKQLGNQFWSKNKLYAIR